MKIISINAGSSSLKFSLFDMDDKKVIASGLFERIGIDGSSYTIKYNGEKIKTEAELATHTDAVKILLDKLVTLNIIKSLDEIDGVGHRLVHGKDKYKESCLITDEVVNDLIAFKDFAPLHNPANVLGIQAFREVLPNVPMVGVFDTAFHQTMDEEAYLYPVPYFWYKAHGVRKYGFHGTSHMYVSNRIAQILNKDIKELKIINCHLGQGASICAINCGKSVDTTMGLTPTAGIPMATRCGDIDPAIIPYIMNLENLDTNEVEIMLNKKSGAWGVSGVSEDYRDIEKEYKQGDERSILALDTQAYKIAQTIVSYMVPLQGLDVITFSGGVGEKGIEARERICKHLEFLGIKLDKDRNNVRACEALISTDDSKVKLYVVPTNEELMIARDTYEIVKNI